MRKMIAATIALALGFGAYSYFGTDALADQKIEEVSSKVCFSAEELEHEATWLTWPHEYTYGEEYAAELESIWIEMTKALAPGEKVKIIAYDEELKEHITQVLEANGVNLRQIEFLIAKSDDTWVRDTGPMFVNDDGELKIVDFGFDGWGKKTAYKNEV